MLPSLLLMLVLLYYPFFENIVNSFFEIRSLVSPREEFVGLHNYQKFFLGDEMTIISLKNSLVLMVLILISMALMKKFADDDSGNLLV